MHPEFSETNFLGEKQEHWLGKRLIHGDLPLANRKHVGLISSRLGRKLEKKANWFRFLRTAVGQAARDGYVIVTAKGTTCDRFVRHCAASLGADVLTIVTPPRGMTDVSLWKEWVQRQSNSSNLAAKDHHFTTEANTTPCLSTTDNSHRSIYLSPLLATTSSDTKLCPADHLDQSKFAIADLAVIAFCDQIRALQVRKNSKTHKLLEFITRLSFDSRLDSKPSKTQPQSAHPRQPRTQTLVALDESMVSSAVREPLLEMGALGWHIYYRQIYQHSIQPVSTLELSASKTKDRLSNGIAAPSELSTNEQPTETCRSYIDFDDAQFLKHWTRASHQPWPDESEQQYLDNLVFSESPAPHDAFSTLGNIVASETLYASAAGIRGGFEVVCFTDVSLADFSKHRKFQKHRGRWDFTSYGIAIRKSALPQNRLEKVSYLPESSYQDLSSAEKPFFQKHEELDKHGGEATDWSLESEWRLLGNLDLTEFGPQDAAIFVASGNEAKQLARISPWPVYVMAENIHGGPGAKPIDI